MSKKVKALLVKPSQEPIEINIESSYEYKRYNIFNDDTIEIIPLSNYFDNKLLKNIDITINENSKLYPLEPNRDLKIDMIFGDFLLTATKATEDDIIDIDLTSEQIELLKDIFSLERNKELEQLKHITNNSKAMWEKLASNFMHFNFIPILELDNHENEEESI